MKSKIADRIINNTSKETIDKVDQYALKTIEMNKELEQKAKGLNYYKKNAEEDYIKTPISVLRYISELEQNTLTLDTKIDEKGYRVDEPEFSALEMISPAVDKKSKIERYQKARTVRE